MKYYVFLIFTAIVFLGCSDGIKKSKFKDGIYFVEGLRDKDSSLQGPVNYYDTNNKLVANINYLNNSKNGLATNYYQNGVINDKTFFYFGRENGDHFVYDSLGKIIYKDYYYYGKKMGPVCFYNENQDIKECFFLDFEGKTLFYHSYIDSTNIFRNQNDYFNMNISNIISNGEKGMNLFLYILQPPKYSFIYKICAKNSNGEIRTLLTIPSSLVFYEKSLPSLESQSNYCLSLTIYDSSNQKQQTILKEILMPD